MTHRETTCAGCEAGDDHDCERYGTPAATPDETLEMDTYALSAHEEREIGERAYRDALPHPDEYRD